MALKILYIHGMNGTGSNFSKAFKNAGACVVGTFYYDPEELNDKGHRTRLIKEVAAFKADAVVASSLGALVALGAGFQLRQSQKLPPLYLMAPALDFKVLEKRFFINISQSNRDMLKHQAYQLGCENHVILGRYDDLFYWKDTINSFPEATLHVVDDNHLLRNLGYGLLKRLLK